MSEHYQTCVYLGEGLASYGFGDGHPFNPQRHGVFERAFKDKGLDRQCCVCAPVITDAAHIERFHTPDYVQRVQAQSKSGMGYLDYGDTPAFKGVYEAAATVVGTVLDGIAHIINQDCKYVFIPIAGLHHAKRQQAAGFCVFNDCGVAIETLLGECGFSRIAYVDIDAHHGDGVYYGFEDNPGVIFADLHQDGRTLYPGTGHQAENGIGTARGTKLNIPMPPGATDELFLKAWKKVEDFLHDHPPEFVLLQCGADSIANDPITAMRYTAASHAHATRRLRELADNYCDGRLLAMGGGGYNLNNLATGWTAVVTELC